MGKKVFSILNSGNGGAEVILHDENDRYIAVPPGKCAEFSKSDHIGGGLVVSFNHEREIEKVKEKIMQFLCGLTTFEVEKVLKNVQERLSL